MDKFWVVTDPHPTSTVGDMMFETTARDFMLQALGGLPLDANPRIYATREAALLNAKLRAFTMLEQSRGLYAQVDAALETMVDPGEDEALRAAREACEAALPYVKAYADQHPGSGEDIAAAANKLRAAIAGMRAPR